MGMLAAAAASAILASPQTPQGHRTLSGAWSLRLRSASPGVAALRSLTFMLSRLHDFSPKCYITKVEVDVSNVNNEEDFEDHPSLAPSCSIPLIPFRGDILDPAHFSLQDRASCPSDFEELPVLSEGEQHALASTPAHPAGLYALYASYLFGNLVEQLWNFAWPAALAILHPSLLPVAIVGFFTKVPAILLKLREIFVSVI
ncbi:hypothetical protein PR202_ga12176 [Eleusine coracana subsp. coracana]|uniref:Solute carrier family 40 member n=1 Tax=Eleusine coracana subsp. coracana TaxID=191504 RepID=A0AAV5CBG6_ELECO|nr:hypothetical protein PR202_ga12176 [Eleusine coracana subsp. coracana]